MSKVLAFLTVFWMVPVFAQVTLEFTPLAGSTVSAAALQDARTILQQRLEALFQPGQRFTVIPSAGMIVVRLESAEVTIDTVIALCTAVGKLEFIDSDVPLEKGDSKPEGNIILTDQDILKASATLSEFGGAVVELELTPEGTQKLALYSKENVGHFLVIAKDNFVLSSPTVQSEILNGTVWIQSNFTLEEANLLAAQLMRRLPFPLTVVSQN